MKRLTAVFICFLFTTVAYSQEKDHFLERLKNRFVVHDTILIYNTNSNSSISVPMGVNDINVDDEDEMSEDIPVPIDTIDTDDKFCKVVLFDNSTWLYYYLEKPVIPDSLSIDHWETEQVHSYKDVALKDLPDEIELALVDSIHGYCIPHPGAVTSSFKFRHRRPHKGTDIALTTGDAVYAAFDGVVRVALPSHLTGGYGNVLVIRHANGLETYYGHLSDYIVESGDLVKAGELIGYGGSTGRSTGPHLHFETRYMGQSFDPERIFDFEKGTLRCEVFTLKKHYFSINSHYGMTDRQSLIASTKTPKASSSGKPVYYKVRSGDTLNKIAKRQGTSVNQLCKLNGISGKKVIKVGQRLRVK